MSMSIKKGDNVKVLSGKDRGKTGTVLRALPAEGKVVVEGVAIDKKAMKPTPQNQQGGIVNAEGYIDASNVMVLVNGKATRVGFTVKDGKKVRVAKATGEIIDK